ncbi:hypothetical protein JYT74_02070 [Crocinitomix catalasitica]|nr:hypothetical protein [Crocinitomix catalasitica]
MRFLLLIFSIFCCLGLSAQTAYPQTGELFEFKGRLQFTSGYYGGSERTFDHLVSPMPNYTILVIKIDTKDSIPNLERSITTDSSARFRILLNEGTYGFALPSEKDSLVKGQYLPKSITSVSEHTIYSMSWALNTRGPIILNQVLDQEIILTRDEYTSCLERPKRE